jgi:hypothetical protein
MILSVMAAVLCIAVLNAHIALKLRSPQRQAKKLARQLLSKDQERLRREVLDATDELQASLGLSDREVLCALQCASAPAAKFWLGTNTDIAVRELVVLGQLFNVRLMPRLVEA